MKETLANSCTQIRNLKKKKKQRFVQTQSKSQHSLGTQELNSSRLQVNYTNLNLYRFNLSNHTLLPHFLRNQDKATNKSKPKSQTQKTKTKIPTLQ